MNKTGPTAGGSIGDISGLRAVIERCKVWQLAAASSGRVSVEICCRDTSKHSPAAFPPLAATPHILEGIAALKRTLDSKLNRTAD